MTPDQPKHIIFALALVTLVAAFLLRRFRTRTPTWLALLVDLLPLAWMFLFTWSLVHLVSDLIPARKHPPFNGNALASAGLIVFLAALVPRRARGAFAGLLGFGLAFLGTCDVLHMRIFGNVIPFGSHGSIFQLWDARVSVASLFASGDQWLLLYFATALTMLALWRVKGLERLRLVQLAAYVIPALALSSFLVPIRADVTEFLDSKWAREVLNREDQVWNAGFLEAHIREISLNIKHTLDAKQPTPEVLEQVARYYHDEHVEHFTEDRPSFGQFKGKNLLVIQIEAFEEWLVGAQINGEEITPYLNRRKERGLFYPDIFNIVASSSTADCEYLVLNSNHPLPDGAVAFRREDNHFVTLATTLRDAGYSTLSMHGYRRGMWNRAVLHPRYGFTHSLFGEELGTQPEIGWGLDDHAFFQKVVAATMKEKAPWFVYAITLSSHHPYNAIPVNRRRLHLGALEGTMVGDYMHSAAFTDDAISQLFDQLRAADLLKDTVVVMYGDHDGHLHSTPKDRANLAALTNIPKNVTDYIPLLMLFPQTDTPDIARAYGAQIDFAPTILHYLGISPPASFMGHAILPGDVGGFVARWDGSFVSPPLIFDAGLDECKVLSDLRTVPQQTCRALADKTRKELDDSWLVTNNDLAHWLVERKEPVKPFPKTTPSPTAGVPLGGACHDEKECAAPEGFDAHCFGGLCATDPHGPCEHPGSTAPCAIGSACYAFSPDLNVCAANCDSFACAGQCNDVGVCVPRP